MSMEVQVKKRVSLQSVLIVPVLVHQVQVHLKFGDIVLSVSHRRYCVSLSSF